MNPRLSWVMCVLCSILICSCSEDVTEAVPDTDTPEINILSHSDGDTLRSNPLIQLDIEDESAIREVLYYIDDIQIGTNGGQPYEATWYAGYWAAGTSYGLHVSAEDASGNIGYSDTLNLFVHEDARIIPLPYQPADSTYFAASTTLTFACEPCPGATRYTLWWRCIACPCSDEWCGTKYVQSVSNEIFIVMIMFTPPADLTVEWCIRAQWDDGHRSEWSEKRIGFIREAPPDPPGM